jgi:hypothetical protein
MDVCLQSDVGAIIATRKLTSQQITACKGAEEHIAFTVCNLLLAEILLSDCAYGVTIF